MAQTLLDTMRDYADGSSWAIWGTPNPTAEFTRSSDIAFPPEADVAHLVHPQVLLVALNPGIASDTHVRSPWHNFHAGSRHNDHHLAEACRGTRMWGGYMTDVHPDISEGNSTKVTNTTDLVRGAVASLAHQVELLGADDPVIIALGHSKDPSPYNASTHRRLMSNIDLLQQVGVRVERVVGVYHYSPTAVAHYKREPGDTPCQRYRSHVHARLRAAGLDDLITTDPCSH